MTRAFVAGQVIECLWSHASWIDEHIYLTLILIAAFTVTDAGTSRD